MVTKDEVFILNIIGMGKIKPVVQNLKIPDQKLLKDEI